MNAIDNSLHGYYIPTDEAVRHRCSFTETTIKGMAKVSKEDYYKTLMYCGGSRRTAQFYPENN